MEEVVYDYYKLLYPTTLKEGEYIRIVAFIKTSEGEIHQIPAFVKTFDEYKSFIDKHRKHADLFNELCTTRGDKNGKKDNLYRRQVIAIDIDAKDYPGIATAQDHLKRVKSILPKLYNHAVIASGSGGVHIYVAIEPSEDIARITAINTDIVRILGGDLKASIQTQLMRIPTTMNRKKDPPMLVKVIANKINSEQFRPYTLEQLERLVKDYQSAMSELSTAARRAIKLSSPLSVNTSVGYSCVQRMLEQGAEQHFRNFALGRITAFLRYQGYTRAKALEIVLDWNQRCKPPKDEASVKADFELYFSGDYKLLGCNLPDARQADYLSRLCNRDQCETWKRRTNPNWVPIELNRCEVKDTALRQLKGIDYLILSVLHSQEQGLTLPELKKRLTARETGKPCLSHPTIIKSLHRMETQYVELVDGRWRTIKRYRAGADVIFSFEAVELVINDIISPTEFKVLISIMRNLQDKKSVTYTDLSSALNMPESNIARTVHGLNEAHVIHVDKVMTEKGLYANKYTLLV